MAVWPDDIIHLILAVLIGALDDETCVSATTRVLSALSSTCHTLRSRVQPVLYAKVWIYSRSRAQELRKILKQSPALALFTRYLILDDLFQDLNQFIIQDSHGGAVFALFPNVTCLVLRRLDIKPAIIDICFSKFSNINELKVAECQIPSVALLMMVLESFPNLVVCSLGYQLPTFLPQDEREQLIRARREPRSPSELQRQAMHGCKTLRSLSISPFWQLGDATSLVCEKIILSGHLNALEALHFDQAGHSRAFALQHILTYAGRTLTSVTIRCGTKGSAAHAGAREFGPLPQLEHLHLEGIVPGDGSFNESCQYLSAITDACRHPVPRMVISFEPPRRISWLDVYPRDFGLWDVLDSFTVECASVTVRVLYKGWVVQHYPGDQGIRAVLPQTDAGGNLSVMTIYGQ